MPQIDWLSHLLKMIGVAGRLEVRRAYGTSWRVAFDQSPTHEIPYHVVLKGRTMVEDPEGGTVAELAVGDIVLWPHGSAHVLHDVSRRASSPDHDCRGSAGSMLGGNDRQGEHLDTLCGRFLIGFPHDRLIRNYLPRNLVIRAAGSRLGGLVGLMCMESDSVKPGGYAILNELSSGLFALVSRAASESEHAPVGLLALARDPRLAPAMSAIFAQPDRPWTPLGLADLCGMSRTAFMRRFRNRAGRSASELLTDIRMSLAANELKKPAMTIKVVAGSIGYRSVTAFRRVFANRIGMTPGQWRADFADAPRRALLC